MAAPDGPQFEMHSDPNVHWTENWLNNIEKNEPKNDPQSTGLRYYDNPFYQWTNSSVWSRANFPTEHLQARDAIWGEYGSRKYWNSDPNVARRQKPLRQRPSSGSRRSGDLDRMDVDTSRPEFLHEMMKGTGAPEHVTVYHRGDIPENSQYASGSVEPNWLDRTNTGGRKNDVSINRGRLHIYLVPHEDILHAGDGSEGEVFFRRGLPFNKTTRSPRRQKRVESLMEDVLELDYKQSRNEQGKFARD